MYRHGDDFFFTFILLVHPRGHLRDAGGHIILDFRSSDNPDFGNTRPLERRNPGQNSQLAELGTSPNYTRDRWVIFCCSLWKNLSESDDLGIWLNGATVILSLFATIALFLGRHEKQRAIVVEGSLIVQVV